MTIEAEQKNCKGKEMTIVNGRNRITEQFEKNKGILTPIYAHVIYRYGLISDTPHCLNCLDDLKEMKNIVKVGYFAAVRNKDGGINISFSKCRVSDFFAFYEESYGRDVARYKALRNETFGIDQIILSKQTGEILRSSYQSIDSVSSSETDPTDQNEQESPSEISLEQAKTIVLKDAGIHASAATFTKEKKDQDHGTIVYELEFKTSDTYYEYEISINGMILEVDMEIFDYRSATGNEISMEEAIQKVLAKVKGASRENIHIEEDWDDGMHLFEGELYYDHTKYEFEIDAATGTLLEWSMETQG